MVEGRDGEPVGEGSFVICDLWFTHYTDCVILTNGQHQFLSVRNIWGLQYIGAGLQYIGAPKCSWLNIGLFWSGFSSNVKNVQFWYLGLSFFGSAIFFNMTNHDYTSGHHFFRFPGNNGTLLSDVRNMTCLPKTVPKWRVVDRNSDFCLGNQIFCQKGFFWPRRDNHVTRWTSHNSCFCFRVMADWVQEGMFFFLEIFYPAPLWCSVCC